MTVRGILWLINIPLEHSWKVEWLVRFGRATKVGFVVVGIPSWLNLDSVAPSGYESGVLFVTG